MFRQVKRFTQRIALMEAKRTTRSSKRKSDLEEAAPVAAPVVKVKKLKKLVPAQPAPSESVSSGGPYPGHKKQAIVKGAAAASPEPSSALFSSKVHADGIRRCWGTEIGTMGHYHDCEWGHAVHGSTNADRLLFRQLVLQGMQAGLAWKIVHAKTPAMEARFEKFDFRKLALWGDSEVASAMADEGIIRSKSKITAVVSNAKLAAGMADFTSFVVNICGHVAERERLQQVPSRSGSHMRSPTAACVYDDADGTHPTPHVLRAVTAFKKAGFKFIGPAIMLSFMQACGFMNHHAPDCAAFQTAEAAYTAAEKHYSQRLAAP